MKRNLHCFTIFFQSIGLPVAAKKIFSIGPRWIAFGGSYPGSLAAWVRLKYPHLIHGAVSVSGKKLCFKSE